MIKRQLALGLVLMLALLNTNCGSADISTVIKYVRQAMPLLSAAGLDLGDAQQVIDLGNQFEGDPQAATLATITLAFDRMVVKAQAIPNQAQRTVILVTLVAANIALTALTEKYVRLETAKPADPRLGAPQIRASIRRYATRKPWACRDAGSGQFKPMDYCKRNPATTTVETR